MPRPDWSRLERYARWKSRLRWAMLPDDLVAAIADHLAPADLTALVDALVADADEHPDAVPACLRARWALCRVRAAFGDFVRRRLEDEIMFLTRDCTSAVLFFDWSCFSAEHPRPVVEFAWTGRRAQVVYYEENFCAEVRSHARAHLPAVRVTVHQHMSTAGRSLLHPQPFLAQSHVLIPPRLLGCCGGPCG